MNALDDLIALFRAWFLLPLAALATLILAVAAGWAAWRASRRGRW